MWNVYSTLSENDCATTVITRFNCLPSGDVHAYRSPMSARGFMATVGVSKWSDARTAPALTITRAPATSNVSSCLNEVESTMTEALLKCRFDGRMRPGAGG